MKRSEILNKIFLLLQQPRRNDELAMEILEMLEQEGMFPPLPKGNYNPEELDNGWEPEE